MTEKGTKTAERAEDELTEGAEPTAGSRASSRQEKFKKFQARRAAARLQSTAACTAELTNHIGNSAGRGRLNTARFGVRGLERFRVSSFEGDQRAPPRRRAPTDHTECRRAAQAEQRSGRARGPRPSTSDPPSTNPAVDEDDLAQRSSVARAGQVESLELELLPAWSGGDRSTAQTNAARPISRSAGDSAAPSAVDHFGDVTPPSRNAGFGRRPDLFSAVFFFVAHGR